MSKAICIIQGHPHADAPHFCHALADAYEKGAKQEGHKLETIDLGRMDIPMLRNPDEFTQDPPRQILDAQKIVKNAEHVVIIYPMWLGTMPAVVKAFFEQLSRNEFAISQDAEGGWPRKMLKGKSARVIVTMGMPSAAYKIFFGAHSVKGFESGILGMSGFKPVRDTLIGGAGDLSNKRAEKHLARIRELGVRGD